MPRSASVTEEERAEKPKRKRALKPLNAPPLVAILREPDVRKLTGIDRVHRWRLIQEGKFPQAVRLGVKAVGWRSDEIQNWINARERVSGKAA